MLCAGWKCPSDSGDEDEIVNDKQQQHQQFFIIIHIDMKCHHLLYIQK